MKNRQAKRITLDILKSSKSPERKSTPDGSFTGVRETWMMPPKRTAFLLRHFQPDQPRTNCFDCGIQQLAPLRERYGPALWSHHKKRTHLGCKPNSVPQHQSVNDFMGSRFEFWSCYFIAMRKPAISQKRKEIPFRGDGGSELAFKIKSHSEKMFILQCLDATFSCRIFFRLNSHAVPKFLACDAS